VEPFALFCGEDGRFGTHLEVYPRPSGDVYMCGVGGSEYVEPAQLRAGVCAPWMLTQGGGGGGRPPGAPAGGGGPRGGPPAPLGLAIT
jgi:hypothetical protein